MKEYVLAVAGAVLFAAVLSLVAPSGKMGNFIKGAGKLLILGSLVAPFVSALVGGVVALPASEGEAAVDGGYLARCARAMEESDEEEIGIYLAEEFGVKARVEVKRAESGYFMREKITAEVYDFGIIGRDEHIDTMSRMERALEERYSCEVELSDAGASETAIWE